MGRSMLREITVLIVCLVIALLATLLAADSARAATAPPPGNVAPIGFTDGAGTAGTLAAGKPVDLSYTAASATAEPTDPVASCASSGGGATGTVWLKIPSTRSATAARKNRLSAAFRSDSGRFAITVFAAAPMIGTEIECFNATTTSGIVSIDVVLQRNVDTWILVAGLKQDGPSVGVGQFVLSETKVRAVDPAPGRRAAASAIESGRYLITFGGLQSSYIPNVASGVHSDAIDRLDLKTGKWTSLAKMPAGLSHGGVFATPNGIHLPGGRANLVNGAGCIVNTHYVLDPAKGTWAAGQPIPGVSRYDFAAVTDAKRKRGFVLGGAYDPTPCDFGSNARDEQRIGEVWSFDEAKGWAQFPALSVPRQGLAGALVNDVLMAVGGLDSTGSVTGAVEAFDARQNRWLRIADLPVPVYGAVAVPGRAANGTATLVVAGGWNPTAKGPVGVIQVLNFKTGKWTVDQRGSITPREALYGAAVRGQLVAVGGVGRSQSVRVAERFTVDRHPPRAQIRRSARAGGGVRLTVAASDLDSGVASVSWKLAGERRATTGTRRDFAAIAVGRKLTITVVDGAGNATRISRRV